MGGKKLIKTVLKASVESKKKRRKKEFKIYRRSIRNGSYQ